MKKFGFAVVSGLILILSSLAQAGDSGCGLGSVIISKNSKGLQLLSMTTNHSFLSQPLGITFGTSGCSSSGIVSTDEQKMMDYADQNKDQILQDAARGSGDHLNVMAHFTGCYSSASQARFGAVTQSQFSRLQTSSESASSLVNEIKAIVKEDSNLAAQCQAKI